MEESSTVVKFTIPKGELDNNEIHKMAKGDMHETFLLLKKDMAVITSVHMERLMKLRGKHLRAQSHLSQDSQSFYGDSKVLEYVDNVVENFLAMKKLSKSVPSFDLLTSDKELLEKQCEENDDHMVIN
nr:uncharacterized protein LOC109153947 [Ipomoea batatas]